MMENLITVNPLVIYMENWLLYTEFSIEIIKHFCIQWPFIHGAIKKKAISHAIICLVSHRKLCLILFPFLCFKLILVRLLEFADPDKNTLSISQATPHAYLKASSFNR